MNLSGARMGLSLRTDAIHSCLYERPRPMSSLMQPALGETGGGEGFVLGTADDVACICSIRTLYY